MSQVRKGQNGQCCEPGVCCGLSGHKHHVDGCAVHCLTEFVPGLFHILDIKLCGADALFQGVVEKLFDLGYPYLANAKAF